MLNINLEHLHYFRYACRFKSLTQAAEQVGISPQGFSKAMSTLEARLDGKLFVKGAGGERELTERGQALLQCADSCAAAVYELENKMRSIQSRERRIIRIGGWDIASLLGNQFPGSFERDHPGVSIEYLETATSLVDDMLLARTFDLGLVCNPYHPELIVEEATCIPVYFFVHASHPLANRDVIEPRDLEGMPIHTPGRGFKSFEILREGCERAGVKTGPLTYNAIGHSMYEYVSQNRGLGWGLALHADMPTFQSNPDVRWVPSWMTLRTGIGYLSSHVLTQDERDFIDHFIENAPKAYRHSGAVLPREAPASL